jgi:hypothetical protein
MKPNINKALLLIAAVLVLFAVAFASSFFSPAKPVHASDKHINCTPERHVCVMKTIFDLDGKPNVLKSINDLELSEEAKASIKSALVWMEQAQLPDGGWGSGLHSLQHVRDPHAVKSDPATTSLVLLSLLRTGNSLDSGNYKAQVQKGTSFLLEKVEQWPQNQPRLTILSGTQPQNKLGENIDAILAVQYFTTLLKYEQQHPLKGRIQAALQKCVSRIEKEQDSDGGWKGGGWAPVLQSALADHALESAQDAGISVDSEVLKKSKTYQKSNFDTATKSAVTGKAAGVMLYSLSSTTRSSAKEANKAKMIVEKAKKEGRLKMEDKVSAGNLETAGMAPAEAKELEAAYFINENSKSQSTREDVMRGFGSNGGEEFISYLMTGETMVLEGGEEWKKWYENMSKKIIAIQKNDGSWEGHHCITSPVFCTAAAMLILSIQNDVGMSLQEAF